MQQLNDSQVREDKIRVSLIRGLGHDWIDEAEFKQIVQRGAHIPAWDQARVGATITWLWSIGQVERRVTDDGQGRVQWRAHPTPRPLRHPKTDGTDLNRAAAAAAALERQAIEAVAASGRYVNPQHTELRALIRTVVLEVLDELDADDDNDTPERTP